MEWDGEMEENQTNKPMNQPAYKNHFPVPCQMSELVKEQFKTVKRKSQIKTY